MSTNDGMRVPSSRAIIGMLMAGAGAVDVSIAMVGGWLAGAVALLVLAAAGVALGVYVAGAEVFDGQYRKPLRLVRQRNVNMLGWSSLVYAARNSSTSFEHGFKPELERLYAVRLAERHGISLHAEPEKAARLIGPELWPWIDPRRTRRPPAGRTAHMSLDRRSALEPPPPPDAVLRALVDRLETL